MAYLDHIGIAVQANSPLAKALGIIGLASSGNEVVASEKVDTEWFPLPAVKNVAPNTSGTSIELLHPTEPESVIGKFLAKNGRDGVHHLSFRVEDLGAMMKKFEAAGFRFVYPSPKPGAHDCLVNFLHPATTGGVLLELTEKRK